MTEQTSEARNFLTVRQFSQKHPAFPEGGLRHNIFYAERKGFSQCIRRIGRKVLLDEAEVFRWIDQQNQPAGVQSSAKGGNGHD